MATGAATLALRMIGAMSLKRGAAEVPLPASRKTRALFAYLAASDRPVRRDRLCELLWEVPDDPRGALRWSLSKLRGVIGDEEGGPLLAADRDMVRLDCRRMTVDWRTLRALSTEDIRKSDTGVLIRAVTIDGDFLEGLDLPRCDGFQAWLAAMREDVRRWQVALLRELAQRDLEPESGLALVRRWTALDPFDALARVALIERLEATGRRGEADQQRAIGIRKLDEGDVPIPAAMRRPSVPVVAHDLPESDGKDPHSPLPEQQVRFCTASDGTGLAYSIVGEGPPLVKTANWLNHLEYDWDSPVWRHWIKAIIGDHQLVRYDERGNGLSDWNSDDISFETFVDDLVSVVDAAGLERFDLLGISQGCSVSIAYAVRHPERVRKMVLYGGYAAGWRIRASRAEIEQREAMLTLTKSGWGQNNPAFRQMFTTLFYPDATPSDAEWFNELQRRTTSPANAVRLQEAFAMIDVRHLLAKVKVPTLVLHARDDAVIPYAAGRGLAAGIPGAQFVTIESRNHLTQASEPAWSRLIGSILSFLE